MKKIFNGKLYVEGLKQLRLVGFLAMAVMELITVLVLVNMNSMAHAVVEPYILTFEDFNPSLFASFTALAPLLTLSAFSFLNKRSSSDFYHALPTTRASLFVSFFLAIVTWLIGIFAVTSITAGLLVIPMGAKVSVDVLNIVLSTANVFAASLFVSAAVAVAMTITGTTFTNIIVALMLIFVPRILMTVITMSVVEFVPIIPNSHILPPLDTLYNIPFGLMYSILNGNMQEALTFWQGGIYTAVVAVIYAIIACVLFVRRKSEAAGQAAPNRALQAIYRLALATVVCLPPCWFMISAWVTGDPWYGDDILLLIDFYAVAVLVYFAYELITTRKWKNLLKAIPSLGFLVLINVAIVASAIGICQYNLQISPTPEQITSVAIINDSSEYHTLKASEIEIKDKAVKQAVSSALADTIDLIQEGGVTKYYTSDLDRVHVQFRVGASRYERYVLMSVDQQASLLDALQQQEAFRDVYMKLPAPNNNALTPTTYELKLWDGSEAIVDERIYETLQAEINELGFEQWYTLCNEGEIYYDEIYQKENNQYMPFLNGVVRIKTYIGMEWCQWDIQLNGFLPKTAAMAIELANARTNIDKAVDLLCSGDKLESDISELWVDFHLYFTESDSHIYTYSNSFDGLSLTQDARQSLSEWLKQGLGKPIDMTKPFANIVLYYYDYENDKNSLSTSFYFPTDGTLPDFLKADAEDIYK